MPSIMMSTLHAILFHIQGNTIYVEEKLPHTKVLGT